MLSHNGLTQSNMSAADAATLPRATSCPFNPNAALGEDAERLARAARGDLEAQRSIRDQSMKSALHLGATHYYSPIMGAGALAAARMCACHGQPEDARWLASALQFMSDAIRQIGDPIAADAAAGEAISIMENLAAAGDEYCAIASEQLVGLYPNAGAVARHLSKMEAA